MKDIMGLAGLISIYPMHNFWRSIKYPLLIDFCLLLIVLIFKADIYCQIKFLTETIMSVVPNVLGFILTGYTVIISVTESKYLKLMVKPLPSKHITLYQTVNSTFAFVLITLCVTLLIGFISNYVVKADLKIIDCLSGCVDIINSTFLFVLIFLFLYSIFAIKDVVINVFNFGQFINQVEYKSNS